MDRVLQSWGVDGHNSHTNVCSAAARLGYALWSGADRPSPDHANAKFMLLLSSHLETGHYFNPHAQRIIDAQDRAARSSPSIDVRLSNTASMADYWLAPWPGTEALLLLAMAHVILQERLYDARVPRARGSTGATTCAQFAPDAPADLRRASSRSSSATTRAPRPRPPRRSAASTRETIVEVAREIGARRAARSPRTSGATPPSGNHGGWQVARCLEFLCVLVGAVGRQGGTNLNTSDKFVAAAVPEARRRRTSGASCSTRASGRSRTTSCPSCCRTS